MRLFLSCDWSLSYSRNSRSTLTILYKSWDIFFNSTIPSSYICREKSFIHINPKGKTKCLVLNTNEASEPRQVIHNSHGLRVTVRNFTADDSTSTPNDAADDSTSTPNNTADDLTSTSPPVVPIGRGGRVLRSNNVSNSSSVGRGVGRGRRVPTSSHQPGRMNLNEPNPERFRILVRLTDSDNLTRDLNNNDDSTSPWLRRVLSRHNASNNLSVGRGVGRGQNISSSSH